MADENDTTTVQSEPATSGISEETAKRRRKRSPLAEGAPSPQSAPSAGRISFPVLEGGRVDWSKASDDTREKLRRAFTDPATARELGIGATDGASGAAVMQLDAAMVGPLYDGLSALFVAAAKRAGYADDAARVMAFSPEEKAALSPATVAVLNKYSGHLGNYAEEIMLATSVLMIVTVKWSTLKRTAQIIPFPTPPAPAQPHAAPEPVTVPPGTIV